MSIINILQTCQSSLVVYNKRFLIVMDARGDTLEGGKKRKYVHRDGKQDTFSSKNIRTWEHGVYEQNFQTFHLLMAHSRNNKSNRCSR